MIRGAPPPRTPLRRRSRGPLNPRSAPPGSLASLASTDTWCGGFRLRVKSGGPLEPWPRPAPSSFCRMRVSPTSLRPDRRQFPRPVVRTRLSYGVLSSGPGLPGRTTCRWSTSSKASELDRYGAGPIHVYGKGPTHRRRGPTCLLAGGTDGRQAAGPTFASALDRLVLLWWDRLASGPDRQSSVP